MRRTIAAIVVTAVVGIATVAGPVATSSAEDPQGPIPRISCGTLGNPVCALIDQLEAVLAPLAPVLAVTGPFLGELGNALHSLGTLTEQLPDKPAAEVLETVRLVLGQIGTVTKPVLGLLGLGRVDALSSVLTDLEAALVAQLAAPAGGGDVPAAAAAASAAVPVPAASLSTSRSLSSSSSGSGSVATAPSVPAGDALTLGPLALPDFEVSSLLAAPVAADSEVLPVLPVVAGEDDAATGPAVAAAAALSGLLLAVGLILRARQQELPDLS